MLDLINAIMCFNLLIFAYHFFSLKMVVVVAVVVVKVSSICSIKLFISKHMLSCVNALDFVL